jgi:gamma-aminobutyric acid type B receptor
MYAVVGIFLAMDVVVLSVWQALDPLYRDLEDFPHETPADTEKDIEIKPQLEHCNSNNLNIWLGEA